MSPFIKRLIYEPFFYLFLCLIITGCAEKKTAKETVELHLEDSQGYVIGDTIRCLNSSSLYLLICLDFLG